MSVANLKLQAASLSPEELAELTCHLQSLSLQQSLQRDETACKVEAPGPAPLRADFAQVLKQVSALTPDERLDLAGETWDGLAAAPETVPIIEAQRVELERRLAAYRANPGDVIPWEQVEAELDSRSRARR